MSRLKILYVYLALCFFLFCITFALLNFGHAKYIMHIYQLNNPLILIESICIFYVFSGLKPDYSIIDKLGGMMFSVYLIHDHKLVRNYIYTNIFQINDFSSSLLYIFYLLFFAMTIMILCLPVEYIRRMVFSPVVKIICKMHFIRHFNDILKDIQR